MPWKRRALHRGATEGGWKSTNPLQWPINLHLTDSIRSNVWEWISELKGLPGTATTTPSTATNRSIGFQRIAHSQRGSIQLVVAACSSSWRFVSGAPIRGICVANENPFVYPTEWQVDLHKLRHLWFVHSIPSPLQVISDQHHPMTKLSIQGILFFREMQQFTMDKKSRASEWMWQYHQHTWEDRGISWLIQSAFQAVSGTVLLRTDLQCRTSFGFWFWFQRTLVIVVVYCEGGTRGRN